MARLNEKRRPPPEMVDELQQKLESARVRLLAAFPPLHPIDGSLDTATSHAMMMRNNIIAEDERAVLWELVKRLHADEVACEAGRTRAPGEGVVRRGESKGESE